MTVGDCPTGCGGQVNSGHLMCFTCWYRVPEDMKKSVYASWNRYRRFTGIVQSPERRQAREDYQAARDAAIAAAKSSLL